MNNERYQELLRLKELGSDERFSFTIYFQPNQVKKLGGMKLDCFEVHGAKEMLKIAKQYYYSNCGIKQLKIRYKNKLIKGSNFNLNHDHNSKMKPFQISGNRY